MTIGLEQIVRPAQDGGVFAARSILATPSPVDPTNTAPDEAKLLWSGDAASEFVRGDEPDWPDYKVDNLDDFREDKDQRVMKTVRIENPDDPDQWVEVKRIDKMVFKKPVASRNGLAPDRYESLQIAANWDADRS